MIRIKFSSSALLSVRFLLILIFLASFSTAPKAQSASVPTTSPEVVQARIQRARALIAAHQLETAASELESVRAVAQDYSIRSITSIMLMSIYLESGNYGRAEALLEENFGSRKVQKEDYFALAGQAVNGARSHLLRYRSFGISTTDASLPAEVVSDLDRLRSFLERMIAQAKEISNERKAYDSLSLLEDVLGLRLSLARDTEDQGKWESEYAGARQLLASSQTQISSLNGASALPPNRAGADKVAGPSPYSTRRVSENNAAEADRNSQHAVSPTSTVDPKSSDVGILNAMATRRVLPRYPPLAKQAGATGLVRVHVVVDEKGKVIEVSRTEGPLLLRQVAEDAARQWFFETISPDGQPARFLGYIDFNFSL